MKKPPTIKLGKFQIRYIQVPYDNRYYVFKEIDGYYPNEVKIEASQIKILDILFRGLIQDAGYGSLEFNDNLRRFNEFKKRVQKRNEYLDRD